LWCLDLEVMRRRWVVIWWDVGVVVLDMAPKGLWCYGFGEDGGGELFWTQIWCWNNLRTGDIIGGGWCWLGVEVGDFVVFVLDDFFWRPPLLLGSIFVVASSFLWVFGVDKVRRLQSCLSVCGVSRVDWGEGCPYDLVMKSGGPITFDSRSGASSLAQVWGFIFGVLLMDWGE
jgi:hypothetical protein